MVYNIKKELSEIFQIDAFLHKPLIALNVYNLLVKLKGEKENYISNKEKIFIPDLKGKRVLLVEDNEINQSISKYFLKKTNCHVDIAKNGQEAVDKNFEKKYDIILMDLQMPIMDGYEATDIIKKNYPDVPIIALSAAVVDDDKFVNKNIKMDGHLSKPIEEKKLYSELYKWIGNLGFISDFHKENKKDIIIPEFLDGFDIQLGLKRSDYNENLYQKLLISFRKQLDEEFFDINNEIKNNNSESLRKIHTLKGLAGMVGAINLEKTASKINALYKSNETVPNELLVNFIHDLNLVKKSLEKIKEKEVIYSSNNVKQKESFNLLITKLNNNEIIEDYLIYDSIEYIKKISPDINTMAFRENIKSYEFDKALLLVKHIIN
jgi:CheY-like chemotaxis protein